MLITVTNKDNPYVEVGVKNGKRVVYILYSHFKLMEK